MMDDMLVLLLVVLVVLVVVVEKDDATGTRVWIPEFCERFTSAGSRLPLNSFEKLRVPVLLPHDVQVVVRENSLFSCMMTMYYYVSTRTN